MAPTYPFPENIRDACGVGLLADLDGRASHSVLRRALTALSRLGHRGAVDADGQTGDGAGVTTQIPFEVLRRDLHALGLGPRAEEALAVGLVFLPWEGSAALRAREILDHAVVSEGLRVAGYRKVPANDDALGAKALGCRPDLVHLIVARPESMGSAEFERRLFAARQTAQREAVDDFCVASLSHRSIVYKALARPVDLAGFYGDLRHPGFATSFALFHQRFSTNTLPSWAMTQPFPLLAHNGEINTISGNRSWMAARGATLARGASDSASLDETLGTLAAGGREITRGVTLLMPRAYENDARIGDSVRALFEYGASVMEPWDGPAFIVFTDGRTVGAALDRNGLRPARYLLTTDRLLLVASEAGVLDVDERQVLHRGRLGPGDVIAADLHERRFLDTETIFAELASARPYAEWLAQSRVSLEPGPESDEEPIAPATKVLRTFGYTHDELVHVLQPMFRDAAEPLGSMGDDTPLSVFSSRSRLLFSYFKQRFAQVTNPPIDPLRESLVMSLDVRLGAGGDLFDDAPLPPHVYLPDPLLDTPSLRRLQAVRRRAWEVRTLSLLVPPRDGTLFADSLEALLVAAAGAVREGATCLVLTDRGVDAAHAAIPSLLAVSAVHQHLLREGLRPKTSIVIDTGEARDDHQLAVLLGFGADAVCPYLAYEVVAAAVRQDGGSAEDVAQALQRYRRALLKGLLKILSKMGVSTVRSYRGAQLFEALGIGDEVIDRYFTGTVSLIGGLDLGDIALESLERHRTAFETDAGSLEDAGIFRYRQRGEAHAYEPRVIKALHRAIASRERIDYRAYAELVHAREPLSLRDLLELRTGTPVRLEEVEPAETIARRFTTSAMSLGALSPEAQQVLAIGMNRLGARSNSGEGGEPREMFWRTASNGDRANHRIKQVASGRFGVTAEYLVAAEELQIKIAQGSKPGEGGQLPGHKVTALIARLRHAAPGTMLISPPPHHDIYSIEDLAQLIYDLKRVNPAATVSVKLVASAGIGTIAVGVVKAYADAIEISGYDGGTGASPLGSIKNAGTPWELGLSEVHHALVRGGLRGRVRLQVSGGLKTGRDVVMAALMGADEYGFGTSALVATGCVMARQCHLNTCPVGIATQRDDLRAKFKGTPDDVVRFFTAVAGEVREILALLGFRKLDEMVGRTDFLEAHVPASGKASTVRLDRVLAPLVAESAHHCGAARNDPPRTGGGLDEAVLKRLRFASHGPIPLEMTLPITNADRAVGSRVAGELARRLRGTYPPAGTISVTFNGSAGQSFGAFIVGGMRLVVHGEANDYLGKGMSGGEIVVRPRAAMPRASEQVVAGNTLLYGATGGRAFLAGRVGERFAVRNSGAIAVVEGTGDHACEYMTAGAVVILGSTGRNVAAGMSGGVVFAHDPHDVLASRMNGEWVRLDRQLSSDDEAWLLEAIALHAELTGSGRACSLLRKWNAGRRQFRRLSPLTAATPPALPDLGIALVRRHERLAPFAMHQHN